MEAADAMPESTTVLMRSPRDGDFAVTPTDLGMNAIVLDPVSLPVILDLIHQAFVIHTHQQPSCLPTS